MKTESNHPAPPEEQAIRHLRDSIISGKHWYLALLEAVNMWQIPEEKVGKRKYNYFIGGDAFDWLLLAERLCRTVDEMLPEDEKDSLLFNGKPPLQIDSEEFKNLIGEQKYRQHLNYFYGITVEEVLLQVVEDEVRKEQSLDYLTEESITNEAYKRIYDLTQAQMLKLFKHEMGHHHLNDMDMNTLKEFTYWSFKYRLRTCDKARIASDTKKALTWFKEKTGKNTNGLY
ncbi:MAG: hypothetical protein WCX07_01550 [Dehalococcoidales bacterium]|jgi:hypothetical protein|nr:hypothetical protein [Dehalococcoidales bacterium]MDD3994249.1 hypothetical protein [Dehalococcoidales bacterium]NLT28023.1 hypothetical protein [Dehalococcoidales bacterium]